MKSQYNRRNALQIVGSSTVIALSGCTTPEKQNESQNQTSPQVKEPTVDDFTFDVTIEEQFTDNHPAKIQITLTNLTDSKITLSTGTTPPFTSYLSGSDSDNSRFVLNPNVSEKNNQLDWIGEYDDPISRTDEKECWNVTQEVLIEEIGMVTKLESEETVEQTYDIYGYRNENCLPDGDYIFNDISTIQLGEKSNDNVLFWLEVGFTLYLDEKQSLTVKKHDTDVIRSEK